MSGWPNVVGVFHKSCPKQRASYLLESTSDGTKTGPRFWCGKISQQSSLFDKKSSSIPHKNLLTVVLAAPQGVTLSSNVAMVPTVQP